MATGLLLVAVAFLVALAIALPLAHAWQTCGLKRCPQVSRLTAYQPGGASVLLDRHGQLLADLEPSNVENVPLSALPAYVPDAFIAVEDKRFYSHKGVDWWRVGGAVRANLRARGFEEGFSTLTMQLARTIFSEQIPGEQRTIGRKLLEIRVAREIERRFSKREILELYLNHIYFGHGAHGIDAAARYYFGRPAQKLTLDQAAMLAGLPKAPSHYDPRRHKQAAQERRDLVLAMMEAQGRISTDEAGKAREAPLGVGSRPRPMHPKELAPYFVEAVRDELENRFGERIYTERLRVWTTLDKGMQRAAEEELEAQLKSVETGHYGAFHGVRYGARYGAGSNGTSYLQGALVALEVATGDVLAWVGGRDFDDSQFDRVMRAHRLAGSAFKPFVYAAALAGGIPLSETVSDEPLTVTLSDGRVWQPRNYGDHYAESISLRQALVQSRNLATVRLAQQLGYGPIEQMARQAGIVSPISPHPSMPLGTVAVSPLELAAAYTSFAGMGRRTTPRLMLRVEDAKGAIVWQSSTESQAVLDPGVAYLITDVLREAVDRGTGASVRAAGFHQLAAGKTGTSNDGSDVWFVGYTPEVLAAVWVGFDDVQPISGKAAGGAIAAPVWGRMMTRWYDGRPAPVAWQQPGDVVRAEVDGSGRVLAENCAVLDRRAELFLSAFEPAPSCPAPAFPQGVYVDGEGIAGPPGDNTDVEAQPEVAPDMPTIQLPPPPEPSPPEQEGRAWHRRALREVALPPVAGGARY